MAKNKKPKISYEPEADVLRVEVAKGAIDYASEIGNFVVHFSRRGIPLYLEILEASKFLKISNRELIFLRLQLSFFMRKNPKNEILIYYAIACRCRMWVESYNCSTSPPAPPHLLGREKIEEV